MRAYERAHVAHERVRWPEVRNGSRYSCSSLGRLVTVDQVEVEVEVEVEIEVEVEEDEDEVRVVLLEAEPDEALDPLDAVRAIASARSSSSPSTEGERRTRFLGDARWKNERRSPLGAGAGAAALTGVLRSRSVLARELGTPLSSSSSPSVVGGVEARSRSELAATDVMRARRRGAGDENESLTASLQSELGAVGSCGRVRVGDELVVLEEVRREVEGLCAERGSVSEERV